jgi:hypothetical protein
LPFCLAKLLTIASSSSGSRYSVFGPSGISYLGLWRLTLAELQGSPPLPHFSSPARMALQLYKSGGSAVAGTPQAQIQRPATCRIQRCNGKPSAPSYFCNRRESLVGISPGRITEMSLCLTRRLDCYTQSRPTWAPYPEYTLRGTSTLHMHRYAITYFLYCW